tara:strand:+ start:73 stop:462 length:390 start_codon:yes stop_codon:yes gene_type:complete
MLKKLITFLLVISANSFNIAPHKKAIYPKRLMPVVLNLDPKFPLFNEINDNMSTAMVKLLSNTLPQFDSISHIVLTTNSKIISSVLANDNLPIFLKKDIILLTIKMTQEGDNVGGQILELYYNLVDKLL